MFRSRKHRLVKRVAVALAVVVLLVSGYVGAYGSSRWMAGAGWPQFGYDGPIHRVAFAPMDAYIRADLPGSFTLKRIGWWCYHNGGGRRVTWREVQIMK